MTMYTRQRGSLSHHNTKHPTDAAKSMDKLFDKVMFGVLVLMAFIALIVWLQ
ncbi:MAG: hypothetical protein ACRD0S_12795 [Acidimicrobiales bacterium]